jgi:hypothetical protein
MKIKSSSDMHIVEKHKKIVQKQRRLRICPACQTYSGLRIQRPKLIKLLLFWLPVKRYRCTACNNKFMVFGGF